MKRTSLKLDYHVYAYSSRANGDFVALMLHAHSVMMYLIRVKYVVYFNNSDQRPRQHEWRAAMFLADYFRSDIFFVRRTSSKTPDLLVKKTGTRWELKTPTGDGKRTMQNNLREASQEEPNIVIDLSECKLSDEKSIARIRYYMKTDRNIINHLLVITKKLRIIVIK